jgi:hypothetical protein
MPSPSNPPFEAGALLQPRQLQRWLDCNKVNKLTRAETYLELPAFSIITSWRGYSEIIGVFNFASERNFTFKNLEAPLNPNYVACVAWLDDSGNMVRYSLWRHDDDVFYFPLAPYTKQKVKHNFRIEIWSVRLTDYSTITSLTFAGCSLATFNTTFTKVSSTSWTAADPNLLITLIGSTWYLGSNALIPVYRFSMSAETFPFGLWTLTFAGTTPPNGVNITETYLQATALTLYTSVRQSYDYRFVEDAALVTADAITTNFNSNLNIPFVFPTNSVPVEN